MFSYGKFNIARIATKNLVKERDYYTNYNSTL